MSTHFALYDYGQGGLWVVFAADSAQQIPKKYPMLQVFDGEPPELGAANIAAVRKAGVQNIDAAPVGWLADLPPR